jgi:Sugar (and other) transporter
MQITFGTGLHIASSWSWRLPSLLQGASSIFQIVMVFFMPESPRWLVYNGRKEEARAVLRKYHAEGEDDSEFLDFEMAEIDHTIEYERVQRSTSWKEWFRTAPNRYRFFVILSLGFLIQWCGNAILSYYLHLVLNSIGIKGTETQLYINGGVTINGFIWGIFFSLLIDRLGRRVMFLGGMAGMFVAFFLLTVFTGVNQGINFANSGLSGATVAMIFLFGAFYKMAGPTQDPYLMEISPYALRAKTSVIKQFGDAGANLFSGFVNPIALDAIAWKYYIVWCCVLVSNFIIIYLFYPETKGLSLEEVEQMFDGITIPKEATMLQESDQKHPTVEHVEKL